MLNVTLNNWGTNIVNLNIVAVWICDFKVVTDPLASIYLYTNRRTTGTVLKSYQELLTSPHKEDYDLSVMHKFNLELITI